ncbi:hypothetical protein HG531_001503 [Fusarium graminearum]|nr:hypothetical protein HG531_001503 [Fusarium graminearum]
MTNRGNDSSICPHLSSNGLKGGRSRVVDQSCMSSRSIEEPVLGRVQLRSLDHIVKLLAKLAIWVRPGSKIITVEKVGLLRKPVGSVGAGLRRKIDFKARSSENVVWMKSLGDKKTSGFCALE